MKVHVDGRCVLLMVNGGVVKMLFTALRKLAQIIKNDPEAVKVLYDRILAPLLFGPVVIEVKPEPKDKTALM
jgi:hypothetical protein